MLQFGVFRGIPVRAHWTSLLLAAYMAWVIYPWIGSSDDSVATRLLVTLVATVVFLGAVFVHEALHAIVMQQRGMRVSEIVFVVFGAGTVPQDAFARPRDEAWVSVAGPVASLAIGAAFLGAAMFLRPMGTSLLTDFLGVIGVLNLVLGVFNLVPIFPMDGGRILRAGLWASLGSYGRATAWTKNVSYGIVGVTAVVGLMLLLSGNPLGFPLLLLAVFFLIPVFRARN